MMLQCKRKFRSLIVAKAVSAVQSSGNTDRKYIAPSRRETRVIENIQEAAAE